MKKIIKRCQLCKAKFSITYYAKIDDDDATDVCTPCWNRKVSAHWHSTRDVLKSNPKPESDNYSKILGGYLDKKKKPQSVAARYLDNLVPEAQQKKNEVKKVKEKPANVVTAPNIPWLTNHSNGFKNPVMSNSLQANVGKLIGKLKGV